ncbi:aminopeptidase P family protein [Hydrogenimonas thermophila]|uniref:aminopeptidase P family protein n=1 Tax=Hydrogenimonas thermophila TaxID=223786 RepID=UPI002936F635|nr:aminopeptidase P family protein [Hydrogenimonas thermophila]WOE70437.1 aminopeptidase P family protein [Hydrogenimonas thermophila]WOE72954.1 aminopeptidase P family protein [Hydrogenimonas thermophila]
MNYILRDENAIYYECGYSSDNALFLCLGSEKWLITDSRYTLEAKEQIKNAEVVEASDLLKAARNILRSCSVSKIYFNPREWTVWAIESLKKRLPHLYFFPKPDFSHKKRMVKSSEEIELLKRAVQLGSEGFDKFADYINRYGLGNSEKLLHFEAKAALSHKGEYDLSFDPIVAINENAAKPHALPTDIKLKSEDLLLVDAGIKYKRYCSDRTRTVFIKDHISFELDQKFSSQKIQKAYDLVRKAHDMAIEKARSGMTGAQIDRLAREVIESGGMGEYFVHSTGHGVGLDIHEMPYISARSQTVVEDGMVFTIEPGIYVPGEFGIRIEDMVVMQRGRVEVL